MTRRLIVEADGGSRGNPGPAAYGAVVRDAQTGQVLAEIAEAIGVATNNVAEYRGVLAGLLAAHGIDADAQVEARLDSKLVVEQMAGRWRIKHPDLQPLALQVREVFPYERVTWTWVPRAQNAHADRLLNDVLDGRRAEGLSVPAPASGAGSDAGARPAGGLAAVLEDAVAEPPVPNRLLGWSRPVGPPTTVLLVRHGQTPYTVDKRFSGSAAADPPLTELGRSQAEAIARMVAGLEGDVDEIVCSPLRRAWETAGIVADELGVPTDRLVVDDGFQEADFGDWDGSTFDEIRERWPAELDAWLAATSVRAPGGESFDEVAARVVAARDRLLQRFHGQTVVVVTHVTPIKTLVRLALDAPPHAVFRMELAPASLSEIQYHADGVSSLRGFNISAVIL